MVAPAVMDVFPAVIFGAPTSVLAARFHTQRAVELNESVLENVSVPVGSMVPLNDDGEAMLPFPVRRAVL